MLGFSSSQLEFLQRNGQQIVFVLETILGVLPVPLYIATCEGRNLLALFTHSSLGIAPTYKVLIAHTLISGSQLSEESPEHVYGSG